MCVCMCVCGSDVSSVPGIPLEIVKEKSKRGKEGLRKTLQLVQHSTASMGRYAFTVYCLSIYLSVSLLCTVGSVCMYVCMYNFMSCGIDSMRLYIYTV